MKAIMNIDNNILTVNINFFVLPKAATAAHTMAKQFIATLKGQLQLKTLPLINVPDTIDNWLIKKKEIEDNDFVISSYYQVFENKFGFIPNLSILDLLFNMGNESILVLQKSASKH